jgi:hypothetical protein
MATKAGLAPPSQEDIEAGMRQGTLVPLTEQDIDAALAKATGVAGDITQRMLAAANIDELLGGTEPTAALVGVTFALMGWRWMASKITGKGGSGIFALLAIRDLNGKDRVVTTGSQNMMTSLRWFELHSFATKKGDDWWPKSGKLPSFTVRESETAEGNTVYRFAKPIGRA